MSEALLVAQIVLLLLLGRGLGEVMQRLGQPMVIGPLIAGLLLGPSFFGWIWPSAQHALFPTGGGQKGPISGIADIGILMLLLLTGMETDLGLARKIGKPALLIAATGVIVPFCCGFALGQFLPVALLPDPGKRFITALFLGTALSISSIKIVAIVVRDMDFMRRDLGQIIVASAITEDTIGWIVIAITLGIAGSGRLDVGTLAKAVGGTALFLLLSYTLGRPIVFKLIRWANDYFISEYAVLTVILLVMLLMALITQLIGVNTVLGAFVAGVLVGESPILTGEIEDRLRGFIAAFLTPIFFGLSGLAADLTVLRDPVFLALLGLVLIAACVGKFVGAFLGSWLSRQGFRRALALGCAMNARGSTEVIVASIGLSAGALTHNLYTIVVTMAVLTTMAMPPMLRAALTRVPLQEHERKRLEREKLDAGGFVSKFERLLLAVDDSDSGRLASQLAGFVSGRGGLPMTVLDLNSAASQSGEMGVASPIKLAKQSIAVANALDDREARADLLGGPEVLARHETRDATAAVADEAAKGFDVLFVGLQQMRGERDGFAEAVNRIAASFDGPTALVIAGHKPRTDLSGTGRKILLPISGTDNSRRGAELAFWLTPAESTTIVAVHISRRQQKHRDGSAQRDVSHSAEAAVLADAQDLARRYGHAIETAVHLDAVPDQAILKAGERVAADLLVIGAGRRVGPSLYLGETVASLLEQWPGDMVVLAT